MRKRWEEKEKRFESDGISKSTYFAGGFIRTVDDVEKVLQVGATAATTSDKELWKHYEKNEIVLVFSYMISGKNKQDSKKMSMVA